MFATYMVQAKIFIARWLNKANMAQCKCLNLGGGYTYIHYIMFKIVHCIMFKIVHSRMWGVGGGGGI